MWPQAALSALPVCHSKRSEPIRFFCPFHTHSPAASATIQYVGYVCVPHVCTSEPGPAEAQERGGGCLLPGHGGHRSDTLHGRAADQNGECDGRTGSSYPTGETPAAAAAKPGEAATAYERSVSLTCQQSATVGGVQINGLGGKARLHEVPSEVKSKTLL